MRSWRWRRRRQRKRSGRLVAASAESLVSHAVRAADRRVSKLILGEDGRADCLVVCDWGMSASNRANTCSGKSAYGSVDLSIYKYCIIDAASLAIAAFFGCLTLANLSSVDFIECSHFGFDFADWIRFLFYQKRLFKKTR